MYKIRKSKIFVIIIYMRLIL